MLFKSLLLCTLAVVAYGSTQEGLDFLAAKATEEGVVTLPSGLLYKVRARWHSYKWRSFPFFSSLFLIVFYTRAMECITPAVLQYRVSLLYSVQPNPRWRRVSGGSFQYALVSTGNGTKSTHVAFFFSFGKYITAIRNYAQKKKSKGLEEAG